MVPTLRLVLLLAIGGLPLALAGGGVTALIAYDAILAALFMADAMLAPGRTALVVSRRAEPILSLGVPAEVRIGVRNAGSRPVRVEVRDAVPRSVEAGSGAGAAGRLNLPPEGWGELSYRVRPVERGRFRLGPIHLRSRGPLGLAWRQLVLTGTDDVNVYPNLRELPRYHLQAVRGWLLEAGRKRTRRAGPGTEFAGTRDYVADDEYRVINWSATARRGRLVSNVFETEKSQTVLIALDAGRLMMPLAGERSKLDHAIEAALMLAYVAAIRDDRVGLLVFADRVKAFLPPVRGRRAYLDLADRLFDLKAEPAESAYRQALGFLRARQRKRSLVCLFTDLIDARASAELVAGLAALVPVHLPVCIALRDPQVAELVRQEPRDSEAVYQKGVGEFLLGERERALAVLRRRGGIALDVLPRELTPAAVNAYLEIKTRGRL